MKVEFGTMLAIDTLLGIGSVKLLSGELGFYLQDRYFPQKELWEEYPRQFRRWAKSGSGRPFTLPEEGETIALLRGFGPHGTHGWIHEADWNWCLERDRHLPGLRVVRFQNGEAIEVVWEGNADDDGRMQLRQLSLLFPRMFPYGSDQIAAAYLAWQSTGMLDGLAIEMLNSKENGVWEVTQDYRAPWESIPPFKWGLDIAPCITPVK